MKNMTREEKEDKVVDIFNDEMKKYKAQLCQKGAEYVYDKAYEIAIKDEMIYRVYDLSDSELDVILKQGYTLHDFYEEWLRGDTFGIGAEIRECMSDLLYDDVQNLEEEED